MLLVFLAPPSSPAGAGTPANRAESAPKVVFDCANGATPRVRFDRLAPNIPVGDAMAVAPTTLPLAEARPGATCTTTLRVENRRDERTTFDLVAIGMLGADDGMRSVEYLEPGDPRESRTARGWIGLPTSSVTLDSRQVVTVPVVVRVPNAPGPGGHYAAVAVRARGAVTKAAGNVGVQSQIAVPLLVDIAGTAERALQITDVNAPPLVYDRERARLEVGLRNSGNTFASPVGRVRLEGLFGRHLGDLPLSGSRPLLPDATGAATATWERTPWFGRYTAVISVRPQEGGPTARSTVSIWALPPWWVPAGIGALAGLLFWWRRSTQRRRFDDLLAEFEDAEPYEDEDR